MKILLCGAADVQDVVEIFNDIVEDMGFEPIDFINGTIGATNSKNRNENSIEAVTKANIIVFVLITQAGEITWNVEYETAIRLGKPFILLCEKKLAEHYYMIKSDSSIIMTESNEFYKATKILDLLKSQDKYIIEFSFRKENFGKVLIKQIVSELNNAVEKLEEYNRNRSSFLLIKDRGYKQLMFKNVTDSQIQSFQDILMDVFEHKEVRKRIIYFFTVNKSLTDDQIIILINDPEQGVSRATVDHLPELVNAKNNKKKIISALISSLDGSTESGTIRRAVGSILNLDLKIGINYINKVPMYDIGTPRRILEWFLENSTKIYPYLLDKEFEKTIKSVIDLCRNFHQETATLEKLSDKISKLIDKKTSKNIDEKK